MARKRGRPRKDSPTKETVFIDHQRPVKAEREYADPGEILTDPHCLGRDLNMISRMLNARWPLTHQFRTKCASRLNSIIESDHCDTDTLLKAIDVAGKLDRINVANEKEANGSSPVSVNVGVGVSVNSSQPARIEEDDNWYGNAHRLVTESAEPSDTDSVGPGTIQNGSVRKAMGQNGNGTNGHH